MCDINYNPESLKDQIDKEAEESLAETIWGKPANDIITGICNNSSIPANRAIWELVQNARDVSRVGKKAIIRFVRKENEFIFEHNGQPFDRKSILALILQTSSKVRHDIVKVGQYGTGFLTTHKFGLRFKLKGSLKVASDKEIFYNFGENTDYIIDRSSRDKKTMSAGIQTQVEAEQKWGSELQQLSFEPVEHTVFTYLHDYNIEKDNVKEAFEKSPKLAPYVLALNPLISQIIFEDEVDQTFVEYSIKNRESIWNNEHIEVERIAIKQTNLSEYLYLYLLKSLTEIDEQTNESKVTIILPWTSNSENPLTIDYQELDNDSPQLYLYLPLLGTEDWGWNYIVHAPSFTCDKDTRDSLLFVGNGQNNDDQAEQNRKLIDLAGSLVREYLNFNLSRIDERKYLGRVNFLPAPQERLKAYYEELQKEWVEYFESLPLVKKSEGYIVTRNIKVLDSELFIACKETPKLLDALYTLLNKELHNIILPEKTDLIHWSQYIDEWYVSKQNAHIITLKEVCDKIKCTPLNENDIEWLYEICDYLKNNPHNDIPLRSIVPNENLELVTGDLVKPVIFNPTFRSVMKTLIPEETEKFIHPKFVDILADACEYDNEKAKTALTTYITNLTNVASSLKTAIVNSSSWSLGDYEKHYLSDTTVYAILNLYKMLITQDATGFSARMYNLLVDYYDYIPNTTDKLAKECFDVRNCYNPLINDSLLHFTLLNEKCTKKEWIHSMVKELYGFQDAHSFLRNYMVYPDQKGEYKYSIQLKKGISIPPRLKDLYNEICDEDVYAELVDDEYQNYFVETGLLYGKTLADKIQKPFVETNLRSIEKHPHQKLFLEIIENLSDSENSAQWRELFATINAYKPQLMLSVIDSPQKRESIFQIMKVQDSNKLSSIAELSKLENIDRIIQLGKEALARELKEKNDFDFKKTLGLYVETYLLNQLNGILGDNELKIDVIDEQGGQDLKVIVNNKVVYYIEVKSRWENDRSVLMSTLQHQTSYKEKDHYALCAVDMSQYDRYLAEQHIYPEIDKIKDNISVLTNIGVLNERIRDAVEDNADAVVHIAGGYQVLVSQAVISENGISFNNFVEKLKEIVKGHIGNKTWSK
ncbi:hypothetical protein [uncultured Bacteroides sp.]|uniref:sacsin N-terminal ATP-binding-like domain-containing protein n=1 Tax=uncultured Bacteroides sp. TaxID=162156 RepID=UPI0026179C1F|nr:hypothetical protein [uncultured Bacteroides sp.]